MVKAKKWILAHHFDGTPKDSDMKLVEETLPELKDGGMFDNVCHVYTSQSTTRLCTAR